MKTVFYIREKRINGRYLRENGFDDTYSKILKFDTVAEAEHEIVWRIQHREIEPGEYSIVPSATL